MRVIINADDLGATEAVNDAILELMARKCVTSATLLANGPFIDKATKELVHFPYCSFGIHLNCTEFMPLAPKKGLAEILDGRGSFDRRLNDNPAAVKKHSSLLCAIAKEWSCQIEKLLSRGIILSHFDSHHHVHTLPFLFPALKYLQRKYRITRVRISKNIYKPNDNVSSIKLSTKYIYNFLLRNVYKTTTTSGFTDLATFYENARLGRLRHNTVEVMVHPGCIVEEAGESGLVWSAWKEDVPFKIELINYMQL